MGWSNKADEQAWRRDYYWANRDQKLKTLKDSQIRRRAENQARVVAYLEEHPCVDCGERDILVLQFDHVRGKKRGSISYMVHAPLAWETIAKEIAKCDVRCANDHIRRTAEAWLNSRAKVKAACVA